MGNKSESYSTQPLLNEMIAWRRDFHQHPELGFEEKRTSARVANRLESFGLEVHRAVGRTGVVGILQCGSGNRSIGLRADMDALPIRETSVSDYKSIHQDVMHACGHDGHTSMLLGAAKHLAWEGNFNGRVVFIFQPNEEHGLGAAAMIEDGLFDRFDVDAVYGMHNMPGMAVGAFATRCGPITAAESLFEITIDARGGHAALPHMGVDAIVVGAQIVNALQTIVSRKINPSINGVVSITEFESDGRRNVLPGKATLRGDTRALSQEVNEVIQQKMRQIVDGICAAHGVGGALTYDTIFPSTINDAVAAKAASAAAMDVFSPVDSDCKPKLFSEDFAHMANARTGCFVLAGNGLEGSHAKALHSSDYDFNDDLLVPGSSYWVKLVEQELALNG